MYFRLEEKQNREGKIMFTTGDKLLNMMKEEEIGIMELSRISGVPERTIFPCFMNAKPLSVLIHKLPLIPFISP